MLSLEFIFLSMFNSPCHTASAPPNEPPASPDAGWIHILSNISDLSSSPFATQFNATPPARQRFGISNSSLNDLANFITISSVTFWIDAATSIWNCVNSSFLESRGFWPKRILNFSFVIVKPVA